MEQYSRTEKMIGYENLEKLKNTSVLIAGIGGVGGIALEMIARCGVGNIIIIDFDAFEESNLNRQILSLKNNIGKSKVMVAKERIKEINDSIKVNTIEKKLDNNLEEIIPKTDYIIDACDDVVAKVALVKYAIKHSIKIISCCGTGNRLNPELLKISNIWKTEYDPLAKKFRHELKKENIKYKLPVVYSEEKPVLKENGVIGSMALVPNAAGILLASYVINHIIKEEKI